MVDEEELEEDEEAIYTVWIELSRRRDEIHIFIITISRSPSSHDRRVRFEGIPRLACGLWHGLSDPRLDAHIVSSIEI